MPGPMIRSTCSRKAMTELLLEAGRDDAAWRRAISGVDGADVYDDPVYARSTAERIEGGEAWLAAYSGEEGDAFSVVALRRIGDLPFARNLEAGSGPGLCDVATPYGYGGPRLAPAAGKSGKLGERFGSLMRRFCTEHRVVTEFVRFHPSCDPSASGLYDTDTRGRVWFLNLGGSADDLLSGFSAPCRRAIRKAETAGLTVREVDVVAGMARFVDLYHETMRRLGASGFYLFGANYFTDLIGLGERLLLIDVSKSGKTAAMGLFLVGPDTVHYHLGASSRELMEYRPNNLLFFHAALAAKRRGRNRLHLGGGMGGLRLDDAVSDRDGLDRFKSGFGTMAAPFYVGRRIWNEEDYSICMNEYEAYSKSAAGLAGGYFPPYRDPAVD